MRIMMLLGVVFLLTFVFVPADGPASAQEEQMVNVKLVNYLGNVKELSLLFGGDYVLNASIPLDEGDSYRLKIEDSMLTLYNGERKVESHEELTFTPKTYRVDHEIRINNRAYLGTIRFVIEEGAIRPINTLPIEDYLKGVVPHEMPALWDTEALKAQAIAARTYAAAQGERVINDMVSYQVYAGLEWHPNSTKAVDATRGQTVVKNERLIETVYSSSNGGFTETNSNAWGGDHYDYLLATEDPYDPVKPWIFTIHQTQMDLTGKDLKNPSDWWATTNEKDTKIMTNIKAWLQRNGYANYDIKVVSIPTLAFSEERTTGKRIKRGDISIAFFLKDKESNIYVKKEDGALKLNRVEFVDTVASRIRAMIGLGFMRSYFADPIIEKEGVYTVAGRGFGHGVGMSQWGAKGMADAGYTAGDILAFYYPGTRVTEGQPKIVATPLEISHSYIDYQEQYKQMVVNYTINQGATITITVHDSTGKQIGTLIRARNRDAGHLVQYWDVSAVPNDTYTFKVEARDQHGQVASIEAKKLLKKVNPIDIELTISEMKAIVNGENKQLLEAPFIRQQRTMIPLRFVSEEFGAHVDWNESDRTITIRKDQNTLVLRDRDRQITVNGVGDKLDVAPAIIRGVTFVPLRFVTENLGAEVFWNPKNQTIYIKN